VVDDIHLLANKERTQEEFFHTFNTLYNAGKQIVLSSDSPPVDIPTLQERLVSRFRWGLVTEIESPCYETRMAILKRKSKERGRQLPDDVARLLAERIDSNIRELEGAVTKLIGYASLSKSPIDVDLVRRCLRELFLNQKREPTMEDIIRVVSERFGVKLSELQSKRRSNAIAYPRQIGMVLARRLTRMSLEEVGSYFGGRDHSTVLHAVKKIERLVEEDPATRELLADLTLDLQGPGPAFA
jgi:chromosomal replication initiator protein